MNFQIKITDEEGYTLCKEKVDALILEHLAESPKTGRELDMLLFQNGIGDATDSDSLAISYSSTGAIKRAAVNSLRWRGLIYNSFHLQVFERPFRYFLADKALTE